jgi:integrating conjugative element protein (TIGR03765 family)
MKHLAIVACCAGPVIALLLVSSAVADLEVLYDSGQSWPIDRYLEPLLRKDDESSATQPPLIASELGANYLDALLPIRSPGLTPGPVTKRTLKLPIPVAFFMIGADDHSLSWLAQNRTTLQKAGALGLLVDASDEIELDTVATVAEGLPITPGSGEDIARVLGIDHYPFAVTEGRIWQ